MNEQPIKVRAQTFGEELANCISHGLGFMLAVAALPILTYFAALRGSTRSVIAASVFSATMILLYMVSALYHALPEGRAKTWANRLDHAAIYLFIAGSYTPFALGALRGPWGWSLFGTVWACAALGVTAKLMDRLRHPLWSTGLYVAMGWLVLAALVPLLPRMPAAGIGWLVAGAMCYTVGALVFLLDHRVRYAHFVWHLFVMGGSACHFFAALWYAI
ncbi:hemolysin III family protein [Paucibacter sp. PLA-PC-4]|uniref:PAQR family membrane homeostasis protein TrhA n=1 Tax=Paucibacter sp. PLA-PC-4 TaxID=2993655 RepID=UPI0022488660|nr:hemolysin III family protein [Paucibacter sp. PLA-PC-4]MCX2860318.1 hemolysin III family protein [Paucibacter sp. PLA-PC-4]